MMCDRTMSKPTFDPPYPSEGLTPKIRALANFIHLENQSPLPMCAISALAGCTLAAQGLIKVKWRNAPASPVGMIFVVEALSGERKTANDQIALEEHRQFDRDQSRLEAQDAKQHALDETVWEMKRKALLRAIGKSAAKGADTTDSENLLAQHELSRPVSPKRPRMLISNITAPAISWHLSEKYPYAGLVSDEGGVVLSSGALSNPAMINSIWDSGDGVTDRMVRGRTEVYGASLTVYLQVQPGVFEYFLARQGKLAHASGNSSRWLYASPPSKQGTRLDELIDLPHKDKNIYSKRIREMLSQYAIDGLPEQRTKTLTDAAKNRLKWFSQEIERELAEGGRFIFMRGAAAKAAENCARLAAVMHEVEGIAGEIDAETIKGAIKLVAWHLNQYRMRFAPHTQMELDIKDLEECIFKNSHRWEKTNGQVKGSELARYAPKRLRQIDKLLSVVEAIADQGKVDVWDENTGGWRVTLRHWFPGYTSTHEGQTTHQPSYPSSRYHPQRRGQVQRRHMAEQAEAKAEELRAASAEGYELWPGCFL